MRAMASIGVCVVALATNNRRIASSKLGGG
jgi:hypothetical protein